jgi:hypothetical protein
MKIFFTAALLIITLTLSAQENYVRWNESQPLTWDDFTGKVNDTSKFDAECFAEIRYNYKFYSEGEFEFDVYANFNKNTSWSRKQMQSKELLKHEQLHFNIAALFAEKLKKQFNSYSYTASFDSQILQLFSEVKGQYQEMQLKYDAETNHSLNKEKQKEWEEFVESELRKTKLSLQLAQNEKKNTERGE